MEYASCSTASRPAGVAAIPPMPGKCPSRDERKFPATGILPTMMRPNRYVAITWEAAAYFARTLAYTVPVILVVLVYRTNFQPAELRSPLWDVCLKSFLTVLTLRMILMPELRLVPPALRTQDSRNDSLRLPR